MTDKEYIENVYSCIVELGDCQIMLPSKSKALEIWVELMEMSTNYIYIKMPILQDDGHYKFEGLKF